MCILVARSNQLLTARRHEPHPCGQHAFCERKPAGFMVKVKQSGRYGMARRYLYVEDNFYANPNSVRQKALEMKYLSPTDPDLEGLRTQAYRPAGVKGRLERRFRVKINIWETDADSANGAFFAALAEGRRAEKVGVHYDLPVNWMAVLIYLTPNAGFETGTSFWQHVKTGLSACPTIEDAKRLGVPLEELAEALEEDSKKPRCWREIDRIGNIYNRAIAFPAGLLHSATRHFGSSEPNGRIYHSFHFKADRSVGKTTF
jgi:hypothetical protein